MKATIRDQAFQIIRRGLEHLGTKEKIERCSYELPVYERLKSYELQANFFVLLVLPSTDYKISKGLNTIIFPFKLLQVTKLAAIFRK